ncbi:hypothetical protein SAMN05192553_10587 [Cyclobacterium xiamenense]|uniref:Uncharacterized protein n=2 Tax=Cyclobacterium xiamenense TaxID=1297121 RepID=A0A1H7A2H4_9BACT|nr:hypothetical protein SAMN05192553_10587 [Cyclobacterium xiamenense]
MQISTQHKNQLIQISCTSPSIIQPGEKLLVNLHITALQRCKLDQLTWKLKQITNGVVKNEKDGMELSLDLQEGESFEQQVVFTSIPGKEGFGEIPITLHFAPLGSSEKPFSWNLWISVFERVTANDKEGLNDNLRKKLVDVVNSRTRNGHIFMADHVRFFSEFLNIEVPEIIASMMTEEMLLKEEGLPVNEELFYAIVTGNIQFYGMEKLELIYEENCEESDNKFEIDDAREVAKAGI